MTVTKVTIDVEAFKSIKNVAKYVTKDKKTIKNYPLLEYVKFEITEQGLLKVTVVDEKLVIEKEYTPVELELGSLKHFIFPAKTLKATNAGKKGNLFTFEIDFQFIVRFTESGITQTIQSYDWEGYPKTGIRNKGKYEPILALRYDTLMKLDKSRIAVANSETRPILTNISLKGDQIIATDSHRLYQSKHSERVGEGDILLEPVLIDAVKSCESQENFFAVIKYNSLEEMILIQTLDGKYYHKMMYGNYPDTSRLIPTEFSTVIEILDIPKFKQIVEACKKLSGRAKVKNSVMSLKMENENSITLSAKTETEGELIESINISTKKCEKDVQISFSSAFMLDSLKQLDVSEKLVLNLNGHMRPFTMTGKDEDTMALVLPIKIN